MKPLPLSVSTDIKLSEYQTWNIHSRWFG